MIEVAERLRLAFADHYPLERPLGRGGMATVYLARDLKHHRFVALKVLHPALAAGLGKERFIREIRTAANLQHPHIVSLYDSGEVEDFLYYVMPYIEGESLRQRLDRDSRLPMPEAMGILSDAAEALAYAHAHGVVHRDVKPENILLSGGHALVADFGIARAVEAAGDTRLTETGWGMGTPAYMSPEQIAGGMLDGRSDEYGLGCVLYEMLTGQPPFSGPNARAIFTRHHLDPVTPVSGIRPEVPPHVDRAVLRTLAKEPQDRFDNVSQLVEALRSGDGDSSPPLLAAAGVTSPPPSSGKSSPARDAWWFARAALAPAVAVGLLGVVTYLGFVRTGNHKAGVEATSVAVVPIEDVEGDTAQAYLAEGLTDELITNLTRIPSLRVINRRTMIAYRRDTTPRGRMTPREIAAELGVDAVVTGTLQRLDDTVHLTAQVMLADQDKALWGETYDGTRGDLLRVQREVAHAVARQIRGDLSLADRERLGEARPVDPEALDLYARGRRLWNKRGEKNLLDAIKYFEQALDHDPSFALAYSGEADAYTQLGYTGVLSPVDAFPKARAAAERALANDSTLAEPRTALAYVKFYFEWDWAGAEREFQEAIRRNPSYATAHEWYGLYLAAMGRFDQATAEERTAMSLDPLSVPIEGTAAWVLHYSGRDLEAENQLRIAWRIDSTYGLGRLYMGLVQLELSRRDSAYRYLPRESPSVPTIAAKGNLYGLMGQRDSARGDLGRLDSLEQAGRYVTPYGRALIHIGLGDIGRTFFELDRAVTGRTHWVVWLNRDTRWRAIRNDPRFKALTRRIGLPA